MNDGEGGDGSSAAKADSLIDRAKLLNVQDERSRIMVGQHVWTNTRNEFRQIFGQVASDVVMFQLWKVYGKAMVKELYKRKILDDDNDQLETLRAILLGFAETYGLSGVSAELKEATGEISLEIANCNFCERATSDKPVCFEVSGMLAGFSEGIMNKKCNVTEIRCIAKGDKACSFIIKIG
ncbi:MAG: V4R domain-containing protein [Conexivisphaerales archaeon]